MLYFIHNQWHSKIVTHDKNDNSYENFITLPPLTNAKPNYSFYLLRYKSVTPDKNQDIILHIQSSKFINPEPNKKSSLYYENYFS